MTARNGSVDWRGDINRGLGAVTFGNDVFQGASIKLVQRIRPDGENPPHRYMQRLSVERKTRTGSRRQAIASLLFF